jgi:hypothetical protein
MSVSYEIKKIKNGGIAKKLNAEKEDSRSKWMQQFGRPSTGSFP